MRLGFKLSIFIKQILQKAQKTSPVSSGSLGKIICMLDDNYRRCHCLTHLILALFVTVFAERFKVAFGLQTVSARVETQDLSQFTVSCCLLRSAKSRNHINYSVGQESDTLLADVLMVALSLYVLENCSV